MNKVITKWIEPYTLLETIKKNCRLLRILKFDGISKNMLKKDFLNSLKAPETIGLYMKNVNNFYLFKGNIDIEKLFNLDSGDFKIIQDIEKPFDMIDLGKAEAAFISQNV